MGSNALSSRVVLRLILDKNREQLNARPIPRNLRGREERVVVQKSLFRNIRSIKSAYF
jgi:hypothetical protein